MYFGLTPAHNGICWCCHCQVDVRQLKYYYMEDDGGGLLISRVDPQIKAAVTKVTFLLIIILVRRNHTRHVFLHFTP